MSVPTPVPASNRADYGESTAGFTGRDRWGRPETEFAYAMNRVENQASELLDLAAHVTEADRLAEELVRKAGALQYLSNGNAEIDAVAWVHRAAVRLGVAYEPPPRQPATRRDKADAVIARAFRRIGNRDGFICRACGSHFDLTVDHVIPVVRGGSDDDDNLQLLCGTCNKRKGAGE